MGFLEHLDELRRRMVRSVVVMIVAFGLLFAWSDHVLEFLLTPLRDAYGTLAVIRPAEAFLNKMKAALVAAIFLCIPYLFYEFWAFVSPGLYPRERRYVLPSVLAASLLFAGGAGFSYWLAMPLAAGFLAEQGAGFANNITVDSAFSFSAKLLLGLGLVFEGPLVILALTRMRLVTAGFLAKKIPYAVLVVFIIAAVITPTPDVLTQTIFAAPMMLLYLLSIGIAWLFEPRTEKEPS
jgi:sec-independent protein translocase protein TatC